MNQRPQFALVIRTTRDGEPPPAIPIDERVTDIRFSSQVGIGWSEGSVGIAEDKSGRAVAFLPTPVDAPINAHAQLFANGALVHEGLISGRRRIDGHTVGVSWMGYGSTDLRSDWYRGASSESLPARSIALDVLRTLAPTITVGSAFVAPDAAYAPTEFVGRYPSEIIEQMSRAGSDGTAWLFTVYNRVASWFPEALDETPDYRIGWLGVQSDEDDNEIYGTASLDVLLPDATSETITRTYPGGNSRHAHIDASDSSVAAAVMFLETWLATRQSPVVSLSFERTADQWIERADSGTTAPWHIRAGQTVQVGDEVARYISKTTYTAKDNKVTIQCGPPPRRTLQRIFGDAAALYSAVRSGSDLLTAAHVSN